jgi:hypothetical protein
MRHRVCVNWAQRELEDACASLHRASREAWCRLCRLFMFSTVPR